MPETLASLFGSQAPERWERTISRFILFRSFILLVGRWTSEEDAALLESVAKYGKRWYEVARALPGRTDDQCAKRYKDAVDPSIRWCNFRLPSCMWTHCSCREGPMDSRRR